MKQSKHPRHQPVIGLLMATELEAGPLIATHGFQALTDTAYPAYAKDRVRLVISGIGKAHAAAATAWMITAFAPRIVCNAGAAGTAGAAVELGQIFQIGRVIEMDRPRLGTGDWKTLEATCAGHWPVAVLATQDHPVVSAAEREAVGRLADLVDMEGAAIVQTCTTFGLPVNLLKFISDTRDGHAIADNILSLRDDFCQALLDHVGSL